MTATRKHFFEDFFHRHQRLEHFYNAKMHFWPPAMTIIEDTAIGGHDERRVRKRQTEKPRRLIHE
jgi:hypothetical protein